MKRRYRGKRRSKLKTRKGFRYRSIIGDRF